LIVDNGEYHGNVVTVGNPWPFERVTLIAYSSRSNFPRRRRV